MCSLQYPRTLALRRDSGRWLCDPQEAYDFICDALRGKQLSLENLFWLEDEKLLLLCMSLSTCQMSRLEAERRACVTRSRPYDSEFKSLGFWTVSTYTTVDMLWSRSKQRWLSSVEKLASLGFAVTTEACVVLAALCSAELFLPEDCPPRVIFPWKFMNVAGDGRCMWSSLFLATAATKGQLFSWYSRQRNAQGTCLSSTDAALERDLVCDWALRLTDMPKETHARLMKGRLSEMEDLEPRLAHPLKESVMLRLHEWAASKLGIAICVVTGVVRKGTMVTHVFAPENTKKETRRVWLWQSTTDENLEEELVFQAMMSEDLWAQFSSKKGLSRHVPQDPAQSPFLEVEMPGKGESVKVLEKELGETELISNIKKFREDSEMRAGAEPMPIKKEAPVAGLENLKKEMHETSHKDAVKQDFNWIKKEFPRDAPTPSSFSLPASREGQGGAIKKEFPTHAMVSSCGVPCASFAPASGDGQGEPTNEKELPTGAMIFSSGVASSSSARAADEGQDDNVVAESAAAAPPHAAAGMEQGFLPVLDSSPVDKKLSTKELFLKADLVCPGIAIKKFKMAIDESGGQAKTFVAVLGLGTTTMYKKPKRSIESVVMGNLSTQPDLFWQHVTKKLGGKSVAALMIVSDSDWEVVEEFPASVMFPEWFCVLRVPRNGPIGRSEHDYSFVEIAGYSSAGVLMEDAPSVAIFSVGKLGTLRGGLANIEDIRTVLSEEQVTAIATDALEGALAKKRSAPWRKTQELCKELDEKDLARIESQHEWDEQMLGLQDKIEQMERKLTMWEKILKLMISVDGNGSTKPAEVTWIDFFQERLGTQIQDAPATFLSSDITFENVTVLLSTHISALRSEDKLFKTRLAALCTKKAKRQSTHAKRFAKQKRKADQLYEDQQSGAVELKRDEARPGFHESWFAGSMFDALVLGFFQEGCTASIRKRRRQLYYVRVIPAKKKQQSQRREYKGRRTKDNGDFSEPVKDARRVPTLHDKLQVVKFYNDLKQKKSKAKLDACTVCPRTATRKAREAHREKIAEAKKMSKINLQKKCCERFPQLMGKAQACKWAARARQEHWEEIPDAVRRKKTTTSNEWCQKVGLERRGRPQGGRVPIPLQRELDFLIADMSSVVKLSAAASMFNLYVVQPSFWYNKEKTIMSLIDDWNRSLEMRAAQVKEYNAKILESYEQGGIHPRALQSALVPTPTKIAPPDSNWCQWWRRAWGWSMLTRSNDAQAWLSYDSADMRAAREAVADLTEKMGVHKGLVLNFDQLWRNSYSTSRFKVAFKARKNVGTRSKKTRPDPRLGIDPRDPSIKGWSSHGQPVDQCHGAYRQKLRMSDVRSLHSADLRSRPRCLAKLSARGSLGFENLDLKGSGQVAASVRPAVEIAQMSVDCWFALDRKVFESAWLVCGYFSVQHFESFRGNMAGVDSLEEAVHVVDPADVLGGSSLCHTPQYCSKYEWQIAAVVQDSTGIFQPLPFEIAHGVVHTLVKHGSQVREARENVNVLENTLGTKPAKLEKAKEDYKRLLAVDRHIVFNRRTGCIATADWVAKHVKTNDDGKPVSKNPSSTCKPWVMTLRICIRGLELKTSLRSTADGEFRRVRCFDLGDASANTKITILEGYQHLLEEAGGEDDEECQIDEGDAGLDPAPAPQAGSKKVSKSAKHPAILLNDDDDDDDDGTAECQNVMCQDVCDFVSYLEAAESSCKCPTEPPEEFRLRPVFLQLTGEGLTRVPPGCGIFLHRVSAQWHSRYGYHSEINSAPTWNSKLRSERKALLLALSKMWRWFAAETKAKEDKDHLARLEKALSETSF
eukprot:s1426_g8.t1